MPDDAKSISSEYVPNDVETYDEWFTRQVEIGLREANDPKAVWVSRRGLSQCGSSPERFTIRLEVRYG
jgi:hypothetical protein